MATTSKEEAVEGNGMHQAMERALEEIRNIYKDEDLSDVEVEEIEWDAENWLITVGFTRPKTRRTLGGLTIPLRQLKRVRIDRHDGKFNGMINAQAR